MLLPVQQWLSDQFIKSINEKEIEAELIGRLINGGIDSKRTYIARDKIEGWLHSRGLKNILEDEDLDEVFLDSFIRIHELISKESTFLATKIYNPMFDICDAAPADDSVDVHIENWRLRQLLKKKTIPHSNNPVHGNKERHAEKREQILGAAFAVLAKWPEECRDTKGHLEKPIPMRK